MKCANCGAEIRVGCVYCPVCGKEAQIVSDYNILEDDYLDSLLQEGEKPSVPSKSKQKEKAAKPKQEKPTGKKSKKSLYIVIFILLFVAAFALIGGILFAKSLSYEGRMEKAEDAYEKKAYEKAISYAKQALEKKKEDALAYAVIGKSYYQNKEDEAAKAYLEKAVPQLVPIIKILDEKVREKYDDESFYIIDKNNNVHMAHIDIHYTFSVNGVASLHTDILKNNELHNFYEIYPEKFNNKTNGITFRRWLMHCNPELTELIERLIGDEFKLDAEKLQELTKYIDDKEVLQKLLDIKRDKKIELKKYLKKTQNIDIDENSIFDIQIKRLHEYKRQYMNALYVIYKYLQIKKGNTPTTPITIIFGAKAAPAYTIAKDIIHLILCLQQLIDNDEEVNKYLKVVMVENYNVTAAEKLSEQISLASKEASGTGNMKFMLNGALTLGTEDGANVEIHELVGDENIFIFGESSETVIEHYKNGDYDPLDFYIKDKNIKEVVDFIVSDEIMNIGCEENLIRLYKEILRKDWFMGLLDFKSYCNKKEEAFKEYENRESWAKKALINISKAGYFSSDRTIEEYNKDIWKLK